MIAAYFLIAIGVAVLLALVAGCGLAYAAIEEDMDGEDVAIAAGIAGVVVVVAALVWPLTLVVGVPGGLAFLGFMYFKNRTADDVR